MVAVGEYLWYSYGLLEVPSSKYPEAPWWRADKVHCQRHLVIRSAHTLQNPERQKKEKGKTDPVNMRLSVNNMWDINMCMAECFHQRHVFLLARLIRSTGEDICISRLSSPGTLHFHWPKSPWHGLCNHIKSEWEESEIKGNTTNIAKESAKA